MADVSRRAAAKPARGGVENAMFVCAAAETLPGSLAGMADEITINYPWGALLRAVALPEVAVLAGIAELAKPGAKVTLVINVQPLRDAALAAKLDLAEAALLHDEAALRAAYTRAGLDIVRIRAATDETLPATSWGRHLATSKREMRIAEARISRR
jgi:16S rRNA (adenine(1408)-N(1))-methyltransferase